MSVRVVKISEQEDLKKAFAIREEVFVVEQNVDRNDEYDQYEDTATHFLAFYDHQPCGTARWRFTEKGVKLERFAVLKSFRDKKVGGHILKAVIDDIQQSEAAKGKKLYLHAQVQVVDFYAKEGFQAVGDMFEECNIQHYKMEREAF